MNVHRQPATITPAPRTHRRRSGCVALTVAAVLASWAPSADAQGRSIGGHVGIASGLISHSEGKTKTLSEACCPLTVPVGIIIRKNSALPLDIGVAPTLDDGRVTWSLGVNTFRALGSGFALAGGVMVDVSDPAWGFVAALDKLLFQPSAGTAVVGDLIVPVLFHKNDAGVRYTSVGAGFHIGFIF